MPARGKTNGKYQGAKWITRERRLALYVRDGLACVYCGSSMEEGTLLTLDHIIPHCNGGTNQSDNLITSCLKCNSSRGDRSIGEFAESVADYLDHSVTPDQILAHINDCTMRTVNIAQARQIIQRRGSYQAALEAINGRKL
jgi:hypothetical protein